MQHICCPPACQVGFGSGFKCNSAVWRALRPIKQVHGAWAHIKGRESKAVDTLLALGKEKVCCLLVYRASLCCQTVCLWARRRRVVRVCACWEARETGRIWPVWVGGRLTVRVFDGCPPLQGFSLAI